MWFTGAHPHVWWPAFSDAKTGRDSLPIMSQHKITSLNAVLEIPVIKLWPKRHCFSLMKLLEVWESASHSHKAAREHTPEQIGLGGVESGKGSQDEMSSKDLENFLFPLQSEINCWGTLALTLDLGIHSADHPEGPAALQRSKLVNMTRRHISVCDSLPVSPLWYRQSLQLFCLVSASTIKKL